MTRLLIASAAFVLAGVVAEAGVAPPVPRLPSAALKSLKSDGSPGEPLSSEKIAERIQQNTKAAADRLAESDPGDETRRKQGQALKDLDELLKQARNQDPMGGEGGGQSQQKDDMSQQGEQQNQGGGSPMGGQSKGGGMKQSSGKSGQQSGKQGWRNRGSQTQGGSAPKQQGAQPQAKGQEPMGKEPTPMGQGQPQQLGRTDPKNAGGNPGGGGTKGARALPLDDTITKHVWGHLPERLRQQMSQYYKEQFMPKYSDMLRQYYASLAEREKAQKKP